DRSGGGCASCDYGRADGYGLKRDGRNRSKEKGACLPADGSITNDLAALIDSGGIGQGPAGVVRDQVVQVLQAADRVPDHSAGSPGAIGGSPDNGAVNIDALGIAVGSGQGSQVHHAIYVVPDKAMIMGIGCCGGADDLAGSTDAEPIAVN